MGNGKKKPPTQAELDAAALAAQAGQDTAQDQQIAGQTTQIDSIHATEQTQTTNVLNNSAAASANAAGLGELQNNVMLKPPHELPSSDAKGILQRLRIFVPTSTTVLNMGHSDVRHGHYNGFGVHTEGHVLFSAMGAGVGDSRMVFESQQNMVIQSTDGPLYFGAKHVVALVSGSNVLIGAPKGTLLHGGIDADAATPVKDHRTTDVPKVADTYYKAYKSVKKVKAYWEYVDAAVNGLELARHIITKKADSKLKKFHAVKSVPGVVALAGAGAGIFGGAVGYTGTVVHGETGIVVGSKAFTSIYGGLVLCLGSVGGIFLGTLGRYECVGRGKSELVSMAGHVTADSRNMLEAIGMKELKIAARDKNCQIDGKTVSIGGFGSTGVQIPAYSVTLSADAITALHGKQTLLHAKNVVGLGSETVGIAGKTHVGIGSGGTAAIAVGKTHVCIQDKKVLIGAFSDKAADPPPRAAFPGKGHHYPSEAADKVRERAKAAKSHGDGYSPPGESGSFIIMTDTKIKVKCGDKKVVRVTSGGWKYPNIDIM